jgi:hypothetical protein
MANLADGRWGQSSVLVINQSGHGRWQNWQAILFLKITDLERSQEDATFELLKC